MSRLLLVASLLALVLALGSPAPSAAQQNILSFGAVAGDNSTAAVLANSAAIVQAFRAASNAARAARFSRTREQFWSAAAAFKRSGRQSIHTDQPAAQTVLVPPGVFYISYTFVQGQCSGVELQIDGTLIVDSNQALWQKQAPEGYYGALHFVDCADLSIVGKTQTFPDGQRTVAHPLPSSSVDADGDGYGWWLSVLLEEPDHRPHLMYFVGCSRVSVSSLYVRDAPMFHFLLEDSEDVYFGDFTIYVDVWEQKRLQKLAAPKLHSAAVAEAGALGFELGMDLPLFPLNTDGVDPSAERVLIEDFYIENYDDAVAVKPCNGQGQLCQCARDMLVRDGGVKYSVGLTIGSVPPHEYTNCVANVTFTDVYMKLPFKALYIKTNPGHVGDGSITDITFQNIDIDTPLWYPLWVGPQQQKQPANGTDTGCSFFYPLNTTCPTQPRVPIDGVTLRNIASHGGLTLPGVLLCDPAKPCTNIVFDHVNSTGPFLVEQQYECHNIIGTQTNTYPPLNCLQQRVDEQPKLQQPIRRNSPAIAEW